MATTNKFFVYENPEKTYHIECFIVIYRHRLRKYPDFLSDFDSPKSIRDGFTTKFYLLVKDDIETKEMADKLCKEYNEQYSKMIDECEDTGNWDKFPFKKCPLVYYK